ncbi:hypothetical protein [Sphingobium yanoikuyae]|uniref:hypothetical protein n=1 Tax=Sphingobium yanoikuyae TaxID=13690 RepID=UPI002FDD5486
MAMPSSIPYNPQKDKKNSKRKAPILLFSGDKGGIGKSFAARILAGLLGQWGYSAVGFDGDARNAHLERYYASVFPVGRPYLRSEAGWAQMFDGWEAVADETVILIDTQAGFGEVASQQKAAILLATEKLQREVISLWIADEEEDSVRLFKAAPELAPSDNTFFLMNGRFGSTLAEFVIWRESQTRAQALARGVRELLLPALPIRARTRIARAHAPFYPRPQIGLSFSETIEFDLWWSRAEEACEPVLKKIEEIMA